MGAEPIQTLTKMKYSQGCKKKKTYPQIKKTHYINVIAKFSIIKFKSLLHAVSDEKKDENIRNIRMQGRREMRTGRI